MRHSLKRLLHRSQVVLVIFWKFRCNLNVLSWCNWWILQRLGKLLTLVVVEKGLLILYKGNILLNRIFLHNYRLHHSWLKLIYHGIIYWIWHVNILRLDLRLTCHINYVILRLIYWLYNKLRMRLYAILISTISLLIYLFGFKIVYQKHLILNFIVFQILFRFCSIIWFLVANLSASFTPIVSINMGSFELTERLE